MTPQVLAIIPARGGSKGVPQKNIKLLAGKPLLAHSILHAKQAHAVTKVIVSTDDQKVAAVAREWGAEVVPRPPEISGDTASSESALCHALDWLLTTEHYEPELVVFLQATSPMRAADDIQRAIETLKREGADSMFSACRVEGFTWRLVGGAVAPVNYDPAKRPLRQELKEEIWEENGSFYAFKPWVLRKLNSRLGGRITMHKMERVASFQIDEPGDFELIEYLMRYRETTGPRNRETTGLLDHGTTGQGVQCSVDSSTPPSISQLLSPIRLLVLDFDGVMTDNRVLVMGDGHEAVLCNRSDSLGLGMLKPAGVDILVLSKEQHPVVNARCQKLGIECIQGCDDKLATLKQLVVSRQWSVVSGLTAGQVAYVGNDVNDLECMRWVGMPIAVADAVPEVLAVAKWVTSKPGGHGAVREICDLLLKSVVSSQ